MGGEAVTLCPPFKRGQMQPQDDISVDYARLASQHVFFVGGPAKSGTTWLQHLLNAHPEVVCKGEGHLTTTLIPVLKAALEGYNQKIRAYNSGLFAETDGFPLFGEAELREISCVAAGMLLARVAHAVPAARAVGEKTPANIHSYGLLAWMFPKCSLLCTVRDPRDCFTSNWHQTIRVNPQYISEVHGGSMARFAETYGKKWASVVTSGMTARQQHPERVHLVRYEDLKSHPESTIVPLFRTLGVRVDADVMRACVAAASFGSLSGGRQAGQEQGGSFFRKGVVGDWSRHLDRASLAALERTTGPLMAHFGYA